MNAAYSGPEGARPMDGPSNKANTDDASLENKLADVVHYVVEIANVNGIDLGKAIIEKDKRASVKYNESPNLAEFLSKK